MAHHMMKCGHAANAHDAQGNPCCAICIGFKPEATQVAETPNLQGRTARCSYTCNSSQPSSTDLAFFQHRPTMEYDLYYCGCRGWD